MFLITVSNTVIDFFKMLILILNFPLKEAPWGPGRQLHSPKSRVCWRAAPWTLPGGVEGGPSAATCCKQRGHRLKRRAEGGWLGGGGGRWGFSSLSVAQCPLPRSQSVLGRLAWCQVLDRVGMGPRLGVGRQPGPSQGQTLTLAFLDGFF